MPRLVKRLLLFLVLPGVLLSGAIVIAGWLALRQFTPERLVRQLETTCNARVQMEGCALSLFSSPARLELTGLQFHPRDEEADRGTPMASRPPIKITHTYLRMRRALIEADLLALLLRRELRVKNVLIDMGDIKCDILPGGGNSLRALFAPPSTIAAPSTPAMLELAAAAVAATTNAVHSSPPADEAEADPAPPNEDTSTPLSTRPVFAATQLPGIVALDSIVFADSRIRIRNRKTRAVTELNELQFHLTDVAVNPADLTTTNRGTVTMTTRIIMTGGKKNPGPVAALGLRLNGVLTPFDKTSGQFQPDLQFTTDITKDSVLESIPALEKIEKNMARARRAGLKIEPLGSQIRLAADSRMAMHFRDGRLTLTQPATLDCGGYALALRGGSMVDAVQGTHDVHASWVASQDVSDKALAGSRDFLSSAGSETGDALRELLIDPLVRDGRLAMDFATSGALSDPDVRIAHPLQDLTDQLKDAGRGLLDRLQEK
jgi:hypothetical protein